MSNRPFQDRLRRRLKRSGASVTPEQSASLEAYFQLLARWNEKINLTAFQLADPKDDAIDRLLVEPIIAARQLPPEAVSLLDIGSGSGSPAIPMRIVAPHARLTMVEAKTRKAVFLLEALRHLNIFDATVETARFERLLTRPELHESFDVLSIRAVRVEASTLLTLQAFMKPHGYFFWFRSATGPEVPSTVSFPLAWSKSVPLLDGASQGRLTILRKVDQGR